VAISTPAQAAGSPADPIYVAIEAHRKVCTEHNEAVHTHMDFEEVGMTGEKLEKYNSLVAETDATYDRLDDVCCDLINTRPTTLCRHSGALSIHQTALRGRGFARLADVHLVRRRHHGDPAEALCYVIGRAVEDLMKAAAGKALQS